MNDHDYPRACRVLALDGGGIKGAYTAAVLHELQMMADRPISDCFDLIVGTSTGGILALGMGLGLDLEDLEKLYAEKGSSIFPRSLFRRGLFLTKYRPRNLRKELVNAFGERKFGESKSRLVLTAFNANDGDVKLIKTAHHERFRRDYKMRVVDAALATSAAPTYFPTHQVHGDHLLIDGGVWANCPALVGVVEAMSVLGFERTEIDVLSIGTTDEPFYIPKKRRRGGLKQWARHTHVLLMRASAVGAAAQAEMLTRREIRGDGFLRLDALTTPKRFKLDRTKDVKDLVALGRKTAEHKFETINRRFLSTPAAEFVPSHTLP